MLTITSIIKEWSSDNVHLKLISPQQTLQFIKGQKIWESIGDGTKWFYLGDSVSFPPGSSQHGEH